MSHYIQYYNEQVGGGVKSVYTGAPYQRGSGIGSFFGSIFRRIAPYLVRGAKAVGKEAVRTGLNVIDDVAYNGANFKEALSDRLKESGKNLKRKAESKLDEMMSGSGYIGLVAKRKRQSKKSRAPVRNARRKTKTKKRVSKKVKKKKVQRKKKRKTGIRSVTDIFGPKD